LPSSVVWKPSRLDYAPSEKYAWLPDRVWEVWGPRGKSIRQHHLFLRPPTAERFHYAGTAHLGSISGPTTGDAPAERSVGFSLNHKLPGEAWLRLGGFAGWQVEVNHQTHHVNQGDLPAFRKLVAQMPRRKFSHLSMTRYEEDSLTVHTNPRRGWLMYLRHPADGGVYPRDREYAGDPDAEEFFECTCGIELEFPAAQTLPRELALRAAEEFFATGELPRCVYWDK